MLPEPADPDPDPDPGRTMERLRVSSTACAARTWSWSHTALSRSSATTILQQQQHTEALAWQAWPWQAQTPQRHPRQVQVAHTQGGRHQSATHGAGLQMTHRVVNWQLSCQGGVKAERKDHRG